MRRLIIITAILIAALFLAGCGAGLIYTHTVEPLNPNMKHRTEMTRTSGQGDIKQIKIPFYDISVTWDDNSIGSIAKEKGLTELYYADRERLSVLLGLWSQETIHLYGR